MPQDTASKQVALSIVTPAFNDEDGIAEFHRRVTAVARAVAGEDYEIVVVNDGSRDRTWARLADLCAADGHLVAVNLSRNHGHQLALTAGLNVCRGRRALLLDSD